MVSLEPPLCSNYTSSTVTGPSSSRQQRRRKHRRKWQGNAQGIEEEPKRRRRKRQQPSSSKGLIDYENKGNTLTACGPGDGTISSSATIRRRKSMLFLLLLLLVFTIIILSAIFLVKATRAAAATSLLPKPSSFEIKIVIFFHSRLHSLMRLLRSIEQAETLTIITDDDENHQQHVLINIFYDGCISEKDNPVYQKLKVLRSKHGPMEIICRKQHLGLKANVLTAWQPAAAAADDDDTKEKYPNSNNTTTTTQYALFLEDDLEVSPFFLRFARDAIIHYGECFANFGEEEEHKKQEVKGLLGVSLFHELFSEVLHDYVDVQEEEEKDANKKDDTTTNGETECDGCNNNNTCTTTTATRTDKGILEIGPNVLITKISQLYIYQQAQSWGAVFFPKEWTRFLNYYNSLPDRDYNPKLPFDTPVNDWNPRTSWKKYLIFYMFDQGRYMIYPNLKHRFSFSQHHAEPGVHFPEKPHPLYLEHIFMPKLLRDESLYPTNWPRLNEMPVYNMKFQRVKSVSDLKFS